MVIELCACGEQPTQVSDEADVPQRDVAVLQQQPLLSTATPGLDRVLQQAKCVGKGLVAKECLDQVSNHCREVSRQDLSVCFQPAEAQIHVVLPGDRTLSPPHTTTTATETDFIVTTFILSVAAMHH